MKAPVTTNVSMRFTRQSCLRMRHEESQDLQFIIVFPSRKSAPYINVEVTVQNTLEQFMSQLGVGGSLGVHLGLSGLSVCALIVACIQWIKDQREKINHQSDNCDHEPQPIPGQGGSMRDDCNATDLAELKESHGEMKKSIKEIKDSRLIATMGEQIAMLISKFE